MLFLFLLFHHESLLFFFLGLPLSFLFLLSSLLSLGFFLGLGLGLCLRLCLGLCGTTIIFVALWGLSLLFFAFTTAKDLLDVWCGVNSGCGSSKHLL
jgi:hypothetical protein